MKEAFIIIITLSISIPISAFGMFLFLKNQIQPIKDFGECINSKVEVVAGQPYLPFNSINECYLETIK